MQRVCVRDELFKVNQVSLERRKVTRYPVRAFVFFTWRETRGPRLRGEGVTRDISASGAYVFSSARPPLNAVLQVEILLPRPSGRGAALIKGKMVVLRVDGETGARGESGFAGEVSHLSFRASAPR